MPSRVGWLRRISNMACGKDGFPVFDVKELSTSQREQVEVIAQKWQNVKQALKNNNEGRRNAMRSGSTVARALERYKDAEKERDNLLAEARKLQVTFKNEQIYNDSGVDMATSATGSHGTMITKDDLKKMMLCCSSMAVAQLQQQQQQQQQQQLAIANGEIAAKLDKIEKGVASTDAVKRLAVEALLDDPKTYEEIEDRAVETLLQRKNEDLILKAAERIKRARRIEEEEEEEEASDEEQSSEEEDEAESEDEV